MINEKNMCNNLESPEDSAPQWDLSQLYTLDGPELAADLSALAEKTADFGKWRPVLASGTPVVAEFNKLLIELETLNHLAHRLSGFASLAFAQNTQDQKAQAFMAKVDEKMADLGNELLFFEIWWKELADDQAEQLMVTAPNYAYWLQRTRSYRPFTLAEGEERVVNLKNITGHDALIALYDSMTNRYRFRTDFLPDGEGREVTRDQLMVHVRSNDPTIRAGAYQELYRVYSQDAPILGQIYQTVARDWRIENIRLRHYDSPLSVRHQGNDLSAPAVTALLETVQANAALFGDFFRLKAKALGLARLKRYDLYAPLVADAAQWDFTAGLAEVRAAFGSFSPDFDRLAGAINSSRRLSARPQAGKQGGAFCYSMLPQEAPWVLMTFNGQRQDLFTLAHELGHAIHSQLAAAHNIFHFHATLPLAETASTFGEMLLADRLLRQTSSPQERANLLFHLLDDAYATVGRQGFFALFEVKAHEMIESGATVDELAKAYLESLTAQFGDAIDLADEFRWEWVSIPHFFHTPFYVYAYSFGQLLVYSLWRQYQTLGPSFAPRLINLLARGGSAPPETILAECGLGPLNHAFWQEGFEVIKELLSELNNSLMRC